MFCPIGISDEGDGLVAVKYTALNELLCTDLMKDFYSNRVD